jgi:hypothetical protein
MIEVELYPIEGHPHDLRWYPGLQLGYLKSDGYEYGADYWDIYQGYAASEVGAKLTNARVGFVRQASVDLDSICDVGVGSGQFVSAMRCKGADVNPHAISWLKQHGCYAEDLTKFKTLTLWDVLEHIEDPTDLLSTPDDIFISTPIYEDIQHVLRSKHLKPGEHIWYFTDEGLRYFMSLFGFQAVGCDNFETELGRDSISSYHFVRLDK